MNKIEIKDANVSGLRGASCSDIINSVVVPNSEKRVEIKKEKKNTYIYQRKLNIFITDLPLEISLKMTKLISVKEFLMLRILARNCNIMVQKLFEMELFKEYIMYCIKKLRLDIRYCRHETVSKFIEDIFSKMPFTVSKMLKPKAIHFLCNYCQNDMISNNKHYGAFRIMTSLLISNVCEQVIIEENFVKKIIEKIPEWDSRTVIPTEALCTLGWILNKKNIELNNVDEKKIENLINGHSMDKARGHVAWVNFSYLKRKERFDQLVSSDVLKETFDALYNLIRWSCISESSIFKIQFKEIVEFIDKECRDLIKKWVFNALKEAIRGVWVEELNIHYNIDVERIGCFGLLKKEHFTKVTQSILYFEFLNIEKHKSKKRIERFIKCLCRLGLIENQLNMEVKD